MTRAIPVIVEKSPSGLNGYYVQVGTATEWMRAVSPALPIERALGLLTGASLTERFRVGMLLAAELRRVTRACVTAEVSHV